MMRKIFGKKKNEDEKDSKEIAEELLEETEEGDQEELVSEEVEEPVEDEAPITDEAETETSKEATAEGLTVTMPYHSTIQERLKFMLTEGPLAEPIEAPDEFKLELMAMGERFTIMKDSMGDVAVTTGTAPDEDVFIRIGNDVVSELLSAANFSEFSTIYLRYYKKAEPGKFVKIELRKPITELNRRGYARVPTLKLLIGAARL